MYLNRYDSHGKKTNRYLPPEQRHKTTIRPREEWIPVEVPVIIEPAIFIAVQTKMQEARRLRPGNAKHTYLLGGIIRCGVCGRTMHGNHTHTRHGKDYKWYVCTGRSPGDPPGKVVCANGFHRAEDIEEAVWEELTSWLSDTSLWLEALDTGQEEMPEIINRRETLEQELVGARKERERLLTVIQKGLVSITDIESRLAELQNREQKLQLALAQMERIETPVEVDQERLEEWTTNRMDNLQELDTQERKWLVRMVISQVVVGPGNNIVIRPKPPVL